MLLAPTKEADLMELAKVMINDLRMMRVMDASSESHETPDSSQKKELAAGRTRVHTSYASKSGCREKECGIKRRVSRSLTTPDHA
jgi:hypothetical protein